MDRAKQRLLTLMDELSEKEVKKILSFAAEMRDVNEKESAEYVQVDFWDNDDKVWNEMNKSQ